MIVFTFAPEVQSYLMSENVSPNMYHGLPIVPVPQGRLVSMSMTTKLSCGLSGVASVPCIMDYVYNTVCPIHLPPSNLNPNDCVCTVECEYAAVFEIEQLSYTEPLDIINISKTALLTHFNSIMGNLQMDL
jgi:hypothetical protein